MKLSAFIRSHTKEIAQEWDEFARTCLPAAGAMDDARLRDHVVTLLAFIADDMDSPQSSVEQTEKGKGKGPRLDGDSEAETHAVLRAADQFTIEQVMAEFRALRASILRLSTKESTTPPEVVEITRFNECIDQMLSESVARHAKIVAEDIRKESRAKEEFISTLSHELRNPVAAISNCSQLLNARGRADPSIARVADILARQTGHLARLLEDLLDVARISRGRINLRLAVTDIRKCVQDAVDSNSAVIVQNEQEVKVDMPSLPVMSNVDCTRVAQVLSNLVNNAAKYSPTAATIEVSLVCETNHAVMRVKDNGVGIEPDLLPHMFDAFHENRVTSLVGQGLGVGLWLSRQLVEMQGGTITAHSEGLGTGAEFCVRLPIQPA